MKHIGLRSFILGAFAVGLALVVAACSDTQLAKFNSGVANFVSAVHTVDAALKDVNATLYANCETYVSVAKSINDVAGQCSKASTYTSVANTVIDSYCQTSALADNGGIAASISVTATSISAAKSTLSANKKACGS